MAPKEKILVVDDEPSIRKYLQTLLEVDGFDVEAVSSGREAIEKVNKSERPDFIILDVLMPQMNGIETLKELMQIDRSLNVIMLSCSNEVGTVVEAIRIGAHDYLTKPFEKTELDAAMLKSRQKKQLATENQALRDYCDQVTEDLSFLAASPQMVRIRQQILQIAPVDVPVFICGESGVGKEVVSRMIHLRSKRRNQPFVKVNCAALPGELLESELFGFEQGAFTGAVRSKPGKFEMANKGTIFLDEIAEMSTHLQAKLLHVLQDHQYSRLGGRHLVETDVRELANFVKRYVILEDDEGSLRELVEMSATRRRTAPREEPAVQKEQGLKALVRGLKDEAEMEAIADALEKTRWCRKDAAKMLGISYKALLYKMRQFNLDTPRTRRSSSTAAIEEPASAVGTRHS